MQAEKTIPWLYYFALGLMLASLPFSNYMMSVSQFLLAGTFILDGISKKDVEAFFERHKQADRYFLFIPYGIKWVFQGIGRKLREFFHRENAPAWALASIYIMHVAGLAFTSDFDYALKDLRIKLPILLLPLILSTTCLVDRSAFRILIYIFMAAVLTGTLISISFYLAGGPADSRTYSIYISHIRFSLLIDLAIFIAAYMALKKSDIPRWIKISLIATGIWLLVFLYLSAYMTGLVIFMITAAFLLFFLGMNRRGIVTKLLIIASTLAFFMLAWMYVRDVGKDVNRVHPVNFESLPKVTSLGNPYWHNTEDKQVENGHYVWLYIATDELREAWNQRSSYEFNGTDKAGQEIKYTLIRFLASKGYRKDAEGVNKLTESEVSLVEDGIASIVYVEKPMLYVRIYKIFWEYSRYQVTHNPSGHSVMQRLEFWSTGIALARDNWLSGVGTGDLDNEFQAQYEKMGSLLEKKYRWHSHNQFLSVFVTFGLVGLAWFLFSLAFPATRLGKFYDYYYLSFFIIIILSMLTEDTLETQAGVTQFAFFSSFYLFSKKFIDIV